MKLNPTSLTATLSLLIVGFSAALVIQPVLAQQDFSADINQDGIVNILDFNILIQQFNHTNLPTPTPTPADADSEYWHFFGPEGNYDASVNNAQSLINYLNNQSFNEIEVTAMAHWSSASQNWLTYNPELLPDPITNQNFTLKPSEGYAILTNITGSNLSISNYIVSNEVTSQTYSLTEGFNLISIPENLRPFVTNHRTLTTQSLCQSISSKGGNPISIHLQPDPQKSLSNPRDWQAYTCDDPTGTNTNLIISVESAIAVYMDHSFTYVLDDLPPIITSTPTPTLVPTLSASPSPTPTSIFNIPTATPSVLDQ